MKQAELEGVQTTPPARLLELAVNLGPADARRKTVERRMAVARLQLRSYRNQTHIAAMLGVGKATVCRDFQTLDRAWREEMATTSGPKRPSTWPASRRQSWRLCQPSSEGTSGPSTRWSVCSIARPRC